VTQPHRLLACHQRLGRPDALVSLRDVSLEGVISTPTSRICTSDAGIFASSGVPFAVEPNRHRYVDDRPVAGLAGCSLQAWKHLDAPST
jgi:hypothetical protein